MIRERDLTDAGRAFAHLTDAQLVELNGQEWIDTIAGIESAARRSLQARIRLALLAGATDATYTPTQVDELVGRCVELDTDR